MATTFTFDEISRIIMVSGDPLPTEVSIQEIINAVRDWEDDLDNMDIAKVADASGKDLLAAGLQTGITLKLYNWRIKFADRLPPDTALCEIKGGNLVALDTNGQPMNPVAPSTYVMVVRTSDVSAGLIAEWTQVEKDSLVAEVVEAQGLIQTVDGKVVDTQGQVQGVQTGLDEAKSTDGTFDKNTDSLEAIRDRGDVAWKTGITKIPRKFKT